LDKGKSVAERLRRNIAGSQVNTDCGRISLTVSIGICKHEQDDAKLDDIIKLADNALYQAKNSGRNRVVLACDPS